MLSVCWHYILCIILSCVYVYLTKQNNKKAVILTAAALIMVSVIGFFVVYSGPFVQSGKTFYGYVTRYGIATLPVFIFAVFGAVSIVRWSKKK